MDFLHVLLMPLVLAGLSSACTQVDLNKQNMRYWKLVGDAEKALKGPSESVFTGPPNDDVTFRIETTSGYTFNIKQMCIRVRYVKEFSFTMVGKKNSRKKYEIAEEDRGVWKRFCVKFVKQVQSVRIDFQRSFGERVQASALEMDSCINDIECVTLDSKNKDLFRFNKDVEDALEGSGSEFSTMNDAQLKIEAREGLLSVQKICFQVKYATEVDMKLPLKRKTKEMKEKHYDDWKRICMKGRKKAEAPNVTVDLTRVKGQGEKMQVRSLSMESCVSTLAGS